MSAETINLSAPRLGFVARFASTEETRYYLHGVYIEPAEKGVVMVATDGHRMAIATDEDGSAPRPLILGTNSKPFGLATRQRAAKHPTSRFEANKTPDGWIGVSSFMEGPRKSRKIEGDKIIAEEIDGSFPDWRRVVPWDVLESETTTAPCFDFALLADFAATVDGRAAPVRVLSANDSDPAVIIRDDLPWFLGVLMPFRHQIKPQQFLALRDAPKAIAAE